MLNWLWSGGGGVSMFDPWSIHHIIWFIAITLVLYYLFEKKTWLAVSAVAILWEIFEGWVATNIPTFPYVGNEQFINKVLGDPISDLIGFVIAMFFIRRIKYDRVRRG